MGYGAGLDNVRALAPEPRRRTGEAPATLAEIAEALATARITSVYQPVVRMADGAPVCLEVLARLEHPQRGTIGADLFVPQAEASDLGSALTKAVVRRAFTDWPGAALERLGMALALNFPLDVLLLPEVLAWLDSERQAAGIATGRIVVELTESQPVSRLADLRAAVAGLRGAGYGLAIDDVGPALRDHQALLALDFTALKLDKELVADRPGDAAAAAFLCRAIAAAHAANLTVIAEGIEDTATWDRMARLGVDEAQGFLIARPMPAAAVTGWHHDWCAPRGLAAN